MQLYSDQPPLEIWPALSGLLSCVASALTTVQLRPGLAALGSDPQSHQCPGATNLLEAIGCADSNEVFLGDKRGIPVITSVEENLGKVPKNPPLLALSAKPERGLRR